MAKPRIAIWDLETGLESALVFRLDHKYAPIPATALLTERYIICGAWRILGEKKIHSVSQLDFSLAFKKNPHDDLNVVGELHNMLNGVDAVVAHYGDNFDMKFFNTRCAMNGIGPVKPLVQIDTWKIAKSKFMFNSNRLDYIAEKLVGEGKKRTSHGMWERCWHGDVDAVEEMVRYCKQDIDILDRVYKVLAPFVPAKLNAALFTDKPACGNCGSHHIQWRGESMAYTAKTRFHRFQCMACGKWDRVTMRQFDRLQEELQDG